MTQIVGVITHEYALLVSDRRLTLGGGANAGAVVSDDECKLVSLCNICGIGYSGLAQLGGIPTHEWIATTLRAANCDSARRASEVLVQMTPAALPQVRSDLRRQEFLLAGWAQFDSPPGFRSHFSLITNARDQEGQLLATPREDFECRVRALHDDQEFSLRVIGQLIAQERVPTLARNMRRLVAREIGPREALRLLVDEVLNTQTGNRYVGEKILALCIPKQSAESYLQTGETHALAQLPNEHSAAFVYFDPAYSELRQHGPTFVCNGFAATDITTENDPARDFQSSEMRLL